MTEAPQLIWTEKYILHTFDSVKGQRSHRPTSTSVRPTKKHATLTLRSKAGVGKSTLAIVVAKELYGLDWRQNLELNASDERGIDIVRTKVKDFARTKAINDAPFKIIFLDECDALTRDAQHALRRTMETTVGTCRFILSCNYSSKSSTRYKAGAQCSNSNHYPKHHTHDHPYRNCRKEGLTLTPEALQALLVERWRLQKSRKLVTKLFRPWLYGHPRSRAFTREHCSTERSPRTLAHSIQGELRRRKKQLITVLTTYGMSGLDFIKQAQHELINLSIPDESKVSLIAECGEAEFHIVEGSDELIQLEAFLARVTREGMKTVHKP